MTMGNQDRISNSHIYNLSTHHCTSYYYFHTFSSLAVSPSLHHSSQFPKIDDSYIFDIMPVLRLHRGGRIKEFRLCMSRRFKFGIDKWFEFALSKKAEIIHLRGNPYIDYKALFLRLRNGFECLKDLCLHDPVMTDQDFKLLLSNCIALESLELQYALKLENVSIVAHTKLKHLNLSYLKAQSIVIRHAISRCVS
ncbi:uncharacterized protein LOC121764797 [Salvia splendens]|uniref:uncharacterized protein LOC121764797 n=1 Tax=Salvia splendens TaxID=180675 RepID=UPI001C26DED5|nr:uncharacterized protein LOC121764797 [Salvia splendens]